MDASNNKTIFELINSLPYYVKNKPDLDKIIKPVNVLEANLNQSMVNALVSQYDQTLPYDVIRNKTSLTTIKPLVPHAGNNLVLNVRENYGENASRYVFGYKPDIDNTSHKYYLFSDVVPTIRDPKMSDYVYVDSSCYENYLILNELQQMSKNNNDFLLSLPLVLKHWKHISNFASDCEMLKKNLLEDLQKNNCLLYYNKLQNLKTTHYSMPTVDIEELSQDECFYVLLTYFLEEYYGIDHNLLRKEEIGRLMYKIVANSDLSNLNVKFPPLLNVELGLTSSSRPKEASFIRIPRPSIPPPLPPKNILPYNKKPPPPPPPTTNSIVCKANVNVDQKQIFDDVNKIYIERHLSPSSDEVYNKLKNALMADDMNNQKTPKEQEKRGQTFIEELKQKIKEKFKDKYLGGFSYDKNKENIKDVDVGGFPDPELEFQKSIVPRLTGPSVAKLGSIEDLKYRLFSNARVGSFVNTSMFLKKLKELYEILSQNSHYFLEYSFKGYDIETFVLADNTDTDSIRSYRLYFEILRGIVFSMADKSMMSVANIPRENLMYIGLSAIAMLNNFGYYIFGDLIAFRNYIDGMYTLIKRLNTPETPIVSLYSSIHACIDDFLEKTKMFVGGSIGGPAFDYQHHFNFFQHVYLLDVLRSHKLGVSVQPKFRSSTMNDDPLSLFWDGISLLRLYNKFSLEKKYLYSLMYRTYFVSSCPMGSKLSTSYREIMSSPAKNENGRAVFLAVQLTDKCTYQEMLEKISQRVEKDISKEIDMETLTAELEKIFGADVIRTMDKLKIVDQPSKVPIFMEVVNKKKLNLDSPTVFESIVFLFVILEKLGFVVTKNIGKTNMTVNIKPALIRENIEKHIGKSTEQCELNNKFVEKYGKELEDLLNKSVTLTKLRGGVKDCTNVDETEVVISLPRTDDLKTNKNITTENLESVFLGKETPISNEISDLEKGIEIMLNTNMTSEDVMYRIVPYYVKEQIKLISDLPEVVEVGGANDDDDVEPIGLVRDDRDLPLPSLFDNSNGNNNNGNGNASNGNNNNGNASNSNDADIITQFLSRVERISEQTNLGSPLSPDEVSKTIDRYLKENYIQSVNRLLPFYDNKISVGNGRDRSYVLLKHTLDTINYLRHNMKVDFDLGIKTGIVSIIQLRKRSDEYCYKIFIIIQYIRHMIEELYHRLRVQPATRVISFNEFSTFFKVITKKLNERDTRLKELSDKKLTDYINQKLGTNMSLNSVNVNADGPLFSLFDSNIRRTRVA